MVTMATTEVTVIRARDHIVEDCGGTYIKRIEDAASHLAEIG